MVEKPFVIWITGLPGSGKSTVTTALAGEFQGVEVLRMDEMRKTLTPEPTYSEDERECVYRAIVYTARRLYEAGHSVIIDATGNLRRWRELAREVIPDFIEVYLRCPLEVCRRREEERKEKHDAPHEIYKKGREGWPVPGVTVPYEEPLNPEVVIDIDRESVEGAVKKIVGFIRGR